ncbi:hypothetical protein AAG570_014188 [Ranatra chinensis]|uniref:Semialdehyde dehydrogenase NAD-binding domain-containing protein n=1 Tax=Ranatra chinensis TaxID=642074 RepID=A0ABD0YAU0_9HEMI
MSKYKIFVDGAEGTTGLRIRERLAPREDLSLITLSEELRKDLNARLKAISEADVSILCLPDAAAIEIVQAAGNNSRICDTSTAHRTNTKWVYGFPEIAGRRSKIAASNKVAVPGCHSTGFLALAAPLVETGALNKNAQTSCHSITGYSGGGKKMIAEYQNPNRSEIYSSPRLYALGMQHKHLPEMKAVSGLDAPPLFCPVVADYYSGMLVSLPLLAKDLAPQYQNIKALSDLLNDYYKNEALIKVHSPGYMPDDGTINAQGMYGKDSLEIFVTGNSEQILLNAWFDNLGKGASGAAVQCMNIMLGLEETTGLHF